MNLPIVCITGQLLTNALWEPLRAAWPDRQIIFADNQNAESVGEFAQNLLADAPERFHLVAHAMGGFVAFEVMRQAQERVAKLILISTLASADGPAQTERRQGYIHLIEQGLYPQVVEERIPMLFPPEKRQDERLLSLARQMAADTGANTFLRQQRAIMARIDSRPSLSAITAPTLLLWGKADGISSRAHQDEMLAAIPQAELAVIEGAGHLPMIECLHQLLPIMDEFLQRA